MGLVFLLTTCSETSYTPPVDCLSVDLSLTLDSTKIASGCDIPDGKIYMSVSGGLEPYKFSLDGSVFQNSGSFLTVKTGVYVITVVDGNGCSVSLNNINIASESFSVVTTVEADSLCIGGDGVASIEVTGDNGPFMFKLEGGEFSESNLFTGLDAGNHHIIVKDNTNCSVDLTVTIPHGFTGVSWSQEILPIMKTACALSGCHNGISRPDLRIYDKAKFYAKYIKQYTQSKYMPFDGSLTQTQIDKIACWVDDGALKN